MIAFRTSYSALTCLSRLDGDNSVLTVPDSGTTRETGRVATRDSVSTRNPNALTARIGRCRLTTHARPGSVLSAACPAAGNRQQHLAQLVPRVRAACLDAVGCGREREEPSTFVDLRIRVENSGKHSGLRIRMYSSNARTTGRVGRQPSMWSVWIAPFDRCGGSPIEGWLAARSGGYERHARDGGRSSKPRLWPGSPVGVWWPLTRRSPSCHRG
jgi:hypothetical protein